MRCEDYKNCGSGIKTVLVRSRKALIEKRPTNILKEPEAVSINKWLFFAISVSDSDFNPPKRERISAIEVLVFPDFAIKYHISGWTPVILRKGRS